MRSESRQQRAMVANISLDEILDDFDEILDEFRLPDEFRRNP